MRISDWSSDVCSSDLTVDPAWADAILPEGMPVQGNLDPLALLAGGAALDAGVDRILAAFHNRPPVFNLGHGIGQYTPLDRKSVVKGKSVSARVDLGGRRLIKKKIHTRYVRLTL